ncbi:leucine-rich repeat-containing protein 27-like isoform X2 [Betta splendens]|uniref:Leucine-rich repeat-containing protein 27-like isoform X2 n=1 Tax=Betta splendens TaxID=158456 RepID=A0A6P7KM77_BETSP|nr:leucine-rich repeat-containing protein 27-like isoform X2 [Betta splendens]
MGGAGSRGKWHLKKILGCLGPGFVCSKQLWIASTMSAPGESEMAPGPQLRFVFGNAVVKSQTPHCLPEDTGPQELTQYDFTETLCLSRTKLEYVTGSILKASTLKHLYLEGNQICSIPHSLFVSLPNLQWLDLRNNQIVSLPAEIGMHRCLKTLLLEGNPLSELPPELGNVITLKGLNLRNCPISFPPQDILHQGLQSILQFLRNVMAKRPVSMTKTPSELPVVEKLQLSELMGSSMEGQDESVDEDELQRFEELKDKMILLDKAELCSHLPVNKIIKASTKTSMIPKLPLFDSQDWKRPEDKRQATTKELKEKHALHEQRKKSQEALQKWRTQAKVIQQKKMLECKQKKHGRQRKREEADLNPGVQDSGDAAQRQIPTMAVAQCDESRSARELERQIRVRVEKIQERRRNPSDMTSEQMAATEEDVEEMRKLQKRLLERKRNLCNNSKNSFTIFTGDTWPSSFE